MSGQIPVDPDTGDMPADIKGQTRQCITNMLAVLKDAGAAKILQITVYLTDMGDFTAVNEVYGEMILSPYPSRVCVGVSSLPKGAKIEISAVASVS